MAWILLREVGRDLGDDGRSGRVSRVMFRGMDRNRRGARRLPGRRAVVAVL